MRPPKRQQARAGYRSASVKRELFLLEVEKLEPELKREHGVGVLESLRRDVLPLYQADDYPGYRAALTTWQERWNLDAPWIREAALTTLQEWLEVWTEPGYYRGGALEWQMHLAEPNGSGDVYPVRELMRGVPSRKGFRYGPFSTSRADVEAQFTAWQELQKRHFTAFLNAQDEAAKAAGGQPTKEIRQPLHIEWAVRWQVQGWRRKQLETHYHRGWSSIRDAIDETLRLIELPKVRGKPGRPRAE